MVGGSSTSYNYESYIDGTTNHVGMRLGSRYVRTMEEIENYKLERRVRTKVPLQEIPPFVPVR